MSAPPADPRLAELRALLRDLASDDRATGEPDGDDPLGQALAAAGQVAERLAHMRAEQAAADQRASDLLDTMMALAARDYARRASVSAGDDVFDALALGLNMLADELSAAQDTQARLQEEIIRSQAALIQELSTPIIPITDEIMVMPLIGSIDRVRAQHVLERLLRGVADGRAHTVIIDITGVTLVDTHVANTIIHAAQAVRLLGAQVALTGIRPEVAHTLVGLGVDLGGLVTWSTMQMGIRSAMRRSGSGSPASG